MQMCVCVCVRACLYVCKSYCHKGIVLRIKNRRVFSFHVIVPYYVSQVFVRQPFFFFLSATQLKKI